MKLVLYLHLQGAPEVQEKLMFYYSAPEYIAGSGWTLEILLTTKHIVLCWKSHKHFSIWCTEIQQICME